MYQVQNTLLFRHLLRTAGIDKMSALDGNVKIRCLRFLPQPFAKKTVSGEGGWGGEGGEGEEACVCVGGGGFTGP